MEKKFELGSGTEVVIQSDAFLFVWALRNKKVLFQDICGYYIYPFMKDKFVLVIAYTAGEKTKRLNLVLDAAVQEEFMEQLQALSPASANLLHMEKKQALRTMGAKDQITFTILMLLGVVVPTILLVMFSPLLWHGLVDSHLAQTSLTELYAGQFPDSNYISFDVVLGDKSVVITKTRFSGSGTSRNRTIIRNGYYPLCPQGWEPGQPVKAVLLVREQDKASAKAQQGQPVRLSGLVRNVLWEGLSSSSAETLGDHLDSPVENPILVEYRSSPKADLKEALFFMSIIMGIVVVILTGMFFMKKRK
jgi:hypothetical protein